MKLDAVDAGLLTSQSCVSELAYQLVDFVQGHRPGFLLGNVAHPVRCRYARLAADQSGNPFSARVVELDENLRSVFVNGGGQFCQARDVPVAGSRQLAEHSCSGDVVYPADLRHDEAASALCSLLEICQHGRSDSSVQLSQIGPHRGHYQSVLDLYISDLSFFK